MSRREALLESELEELKEKLLGFQQFLYETESDSGLYERFIIEVGNFADEDLINEWDFELYKLKKEEILKTSVKR